MPGFSFDGKVAFVSGAASGIGLAIAEALAAGGARVVLADRDAAGVAAAADALATAGKQARGIALDVTDRAAVGAAFDDIAAREGPVAVAANCAGIGGVGGDVTGYDPALWRRVHAVNLDGVFHCMQAELAHMRTRGGGAIVTIASVLAQHGSPHNAAYSASKHAVIGLTKSAALEHAAAGIRVNALCPGFVDTPLLRRAVDEAGLAAIAARHPVGRLGRPEEVAAFACFLLSDQAAFVTGSAHLIDGGYSAQ